MTNQRLNSIKVNSTVEISFPIVYMPEYVTKIEIAKFNTHDEVYEILDSIPVRPYIAKFRTKFSDTGAQKMGIAGELRNREGKIIKRDTLY